MIQKSLVSAIIVFVMIGCGSGPPPRPTGAECSLQSNCGLCSSRPLCVWCGSQNSEERGCFPKVDTVVCEIGTVIDFSDDCSLLPEEEVFE